MQSSLSDKNSDNQLSLNGVQDSNGSKTEAPNNRADTSLSKPEKAISIEWIQAVGTIAVTLVLGLLTYVQTESANKARQLEIDLAKDNQQHEVMSNYLEQMTKLMVEENLMSSERKPEVALAARAITLNAANRLDETRKGQLLKLLYESRLIGQCQFDAKSTKINKCDETILKLDDAKLDKATYDRPLFLQGVDLRGARLSEAKLQSIILDNSVLERINLRDADLKGALLRNANMKGARLNRADLSNAQLLRSDLRGADLTGADLRGADLTDARLEGALLKDAKYDNRTKFSGFNPSAVGMEEVNDNFLRNRQVTNRKS
jgi:uncharacterized protein YjbI with pentapeptide repeats